MDTNPGELLNTWLRDIGIKHGKNLLDELKGRPAQVVSLCLTDMAKLRTRELAGQDVSAELAFAESALADMAVAVEIKAVRTILQVLADSADMAGSIFLGVISKALDALP